MLNIKEELGNWYPALGAMFNSPEMIDIGRILHRDRELLQPKLENVFRAFRVTDPKLVNVIILGQDPYPGGEADGLAFSSKYNSRPYSLQVIFDELKNSGFGIRTNNSLDDWAEQGVLLLNTSLTTIKGFTNAHAFIGWQWFTSTVVRLCIQNIPDLITCAWGLPAKKFINNLPASKVLYSGHPAAQRHGYTFVGCNHFKIVNEWLTSHNKTPIQWNTN